MREEALRSARQEAYSAICPPMNRAERRTAKGRMLVAMAEAAALRAEVEFLRREMTPNAVLRGEPLAASPLENIVRAQD